MSTYTLGEIATRLGGEIVGDPRKVVGRVGTLDGAGPDDISFLMQSRFLPALRATRAGAVIVPTAHRDATELPRIVSPNPHAYFARVCALLHPLPPDPVGVHASAMVDAGAHLGRNVSVGPFAVVGAGAVLEDNVVIGAQVCIGAGVTIGAGTRLWPRVTVYAGCRMGAGCIVHSGAVIGADGFGNAWESRDGVEPGHWVKVPQVGGVVIGDDVEIGRGGKALLLQARGQRARHDDPFTGGRGLGFFANVVLDVGDGIERGELGLELAEAGPDGVNVRVDETG